MKGNRTGKERGVGRVALVGTPNVGKSTLFNALTGGRQHTGNWAGKTVECAKGTCRVGESSLELVDLPGTYSLYSHSPEEEVARDYILSREADLYVVVIDSSCPDRCINLAMQVIEVTGRAVLCFNLIDEAKRHGVDIDVSLAARLCGAPAIAVSAKRRGTLKPLLELLLGELVGGSEGRGAPFACEAELPLEGGEPPLAEGYIERIAECLTACEPERGNSSERFLSSMLLFSEDEGVAISSKLGLDGTRVEKIKNICGEYRKQLFTYGGDFDRELERVSESFTARSRAVSEKIVTRQVRDRPRLDGWLDRLLTGKRTAYPVMLLLLFLVLSITVYLSNYPSSLLSSLFGFLGGYIEELLSLVGAPLWLSGLLYDGIYTTLTEIVAVMLPPMAIFFPLFTLLEDTGFLPRFAYNLDAPFRCVGACGKQSLTMCMGLGCNAVGVTGCRIIDSERERRLAIVSNSLMPCNGRFPTIILVCGMFLSVGGLLGSMLSALLLLSVILLGVGATFLLTFILSRTVYRGGGSFFTIELPPFRAPDTLRVLTRSFIDRTLKVLSRAVIVAIPAGAVIWLCSFVSVGGETLLYHITAALDPIGRLLGFDGVMLTAFILGIPASEIVIPIALVGYVGMGFGEAMAAGDIAGILLSAGWTVKTGVCVVLFSLMHWPCATTLTTVYKETGSVKITLLSALAPTALGVLLCMLMNLILGGI